jgi:hypothetical protein
MLVGVHNNVGIVCDPQKKEVGVGATRGSPVLEILFAGTSRRPPQV